MTVVDYKPFVERMIARYEGGYGWDRADPGGPTKFGITCYDLAEHRHQRMDSMERWASMVKALTLGEADDIYATKYATACQFDALRTGTDCVIFDFGVNSGPSRAVKYAQQIAKVRVDGVLGPVTLEAINAMSPGPFIEQLCGRRLAFLRGLSTWRTFGRGWGARVSDLRSYSLGLLQPVKLTLRPHEAKPVRIPRAYGKAYGGEELKALGEVHGAGP